jgi:hypothetical protein
MTLTPSFHLPSRAAPSMRRWPAPRGPAPDRRRWRRRRGDGRHAGQGDGCRQPAGRRTYHVHPGPNGTDQWDRLEALGAAQFFRAASIPTDAAAPGPRAVRMPTWAAQVYLAGTEGLIGQAEREIMNTGFPHTAIQKEHRGSTRAPGAMRALQGHHRERRNRPVPVQPLRAAPVCPRPLLAPDGGLSGREHRRRRPRPANSPGVERFK